MAYTIDSFDGYVFASHFWHAGVPYEAARGTFQVDNRVTPRQGNSPILAAGSLTAHRLTVDFTLLPGAVLDVLPAIDELLGVLDPRDPNPRSLTATRNTDTVQRSCRVEIPSGWNQAMAGNVVQVVFVSEDPEWVETTTTTASQSGSVSPFSLSHTNQGSATVYPKYRVGWSAQHSAKGAVVGQQYRKRMTLTNTQSRTLAPFPYRIALGNTAALVTATKALASGDDLRVIIDGQDVTRTLIAWNKVVSYAWVVIPGMDAGEVLTIDVVYGNASATTPAPWSMLDLTRPVIDLTSEWLNNATAGSTSTTLNRSASTWNTNQWLGGELTMLAGTAANIGVTRLITGNTATSITVSPAFPAAIVAGDNFLATTSSNSRWLYAVRRGQRDGELARGRFNLSSGSYTPGEISYEGPGSWTLALVADNRDSFGQKRVNMELVGVTDKDPFAMLDTQRTWEGNDKRVYEPGTADGLALTTPVPMTGLNWEYHFDNPNGICELFVGARESGAEDWAELFTDAVATSGAVARTFSPATLDLTEVSPAHQLVTALIPSDASGEIPMEWDADTGSATSGTTTTTTDVSKSFATNMYAGGYIKMLSGANVGRRRAITSNTSTQITHAAFPVANADGDRYRVDNLLLKAILRDGTYLYVDLTASALTDSGLGAETAVYDASMTLWVGAGPAGAASGQHRALIGYAGAARRLFLATDEQVEIDAALRRSRIWNTTSSTYTKDLTEPTITVQYHDGTAWRRSANWLPFGTGAQQLWLQETNIGTLSLSVTYAAAWLGA